MSIYLTMCLFAFTMSISPGAGNIVALTTGANYGFKQTIPFVLGNVVGFISLFLAINLGFGEANLQNNQTLQILGYLGAAFLIYLGVKIVTAKPNINFKQQSKQGFWQGSLLQWLNPKAWMVSLASVSAFGLTGKTEQVLIFACIYFFICCFSVSTWAFVGSKMLHILKNPHHLKIFNITMGSLLVLLSLYLIYGLATAA